MRRLTLAGWLHSRSNAAGASPDGTSRLGIKVVVGPLQHVQAEPQTGYDEGHTFVCFERHAGSLDDIERIAESAESFGMVIKRTSGRTHACVLREIAPRKCSRGGLRRKLTGSHCLLQSGDGGQAPGGVCCTVGRR